MTYTEFKEKVYEWASANAGILVIYADQNAPRPDEKYVTVRIGTISEIGHRNYQSPDNITEERVVKYEDEITASFQAYGEDTVNNLQLLKESLQKEAVIYSLTSVNNIAVRRNENIRNVSSQVDSVIEEHWSYEVAFGIANTFTENVGIIETAETTGTYDDYPT